MSHKKFKLKKRINIWLVAGVIVGFVGLLVATWFIVSGKKIDLRSFACEVTGDNSSCGRWQDSSVNDNADNETENDEDREKPFPDKKPAGAPKVDPIPPQVPPVAPPPAGNPVGGAEGGNCDTDTTDTAPMCGCDGDPSSSSCFCTTTNCYFNDMEGNTWGCTRGDGTGECTPGGLRNMFSNSNIISQDNNMLNIKSNTTNNQIGFCAFDKKGTQTCLSNPGIKYYPAEKAELDSKGAPMIGGGCSKCKQGGLSSFTSLFTENIPAWVSNFASAYSTAIKWWWEGLTD